MTTVQDLRPVDAILAVLDSMPTATTATITGTLAADGYEWPGQSYTRPTVERVGSNLRLMEKRGQVERVAGQSPIRWRRAR